MPANETYNPARASKQVGVPGSTLRHWSKVYREFLSPESNPEPGTERRFTPSDVEILRAVAQLRANGFEPGEIIARLRDNPAIGQQGTLESPTIAASTVSGENTQLAPLQSIVAVSVGKVDAMSDKLESVDRRLERVEGSRNLVLVAVAAFAAGAVVVAVVVWLLSIIR
jgi:DNA-binding transcriptional MerR regulator